MSEYDTKKSIMRGLSSPDRWLSKTALSYELLLVLVRGTPHATKVVSRREGVLNKNKNNRGPLSRKGLDRPITLREAFLVLYYAQIPRRVQSLNDGVCSVMQLL